MFAAMKGYTEIVKELISREGIDLNIKDIRIRKHL